MKVYAFRLLVNCWSKSSIIHLNTYAREKGLFKDICPRMVESAVDILEEMEI